MARFIYSALKSNGQIIKGEIEADSTSEARRKINGLGLTLQTISMCRPKKEPQKNQSFLSLSQKIAFTSELQTLLSAGISILESLNSMKEHAPEKIKEVCKRLIAGIESGLTFADALKSLYKDTFGIVYISIVKAGEDSGELETALERLVLLLRKQENIRNKIISASIYPSILIVMVFGVIMLFSFFVFPRIMSALFISADRLPLLTRILIGIGNIIWLPVVLAVIAVFVAIKSYKKPEIKMRLDSFVLKIPRLRDFIQCINLSNFITVLYISYEAGISMPVCLELGYTTVGNYIIKSKVYKAITQIKQGQSLTSSFNNANLVPSDILSIIAAGEKGGALGKMLHDVSEIFDKKIDMTLEILSKLFEPVALLIISVVVILIGAAFFQGYYSAIFSF